LIAVVATLIIFGSVAEPSLVENSAVEGFSESVKSVEEIFPKQTPPKEQSKIALEEINNIWGEHGREPLEWDEDLYELALFRAEDMHEREYFDHVDPDENCVKHYKGRFGVTMDVAENIYMNTGFFDYSEAIDSWMTSRGHRYNLLFPHQKGAIARKGGYVVFLGANRRGFGEACATGEEGEEFWEDAPIQTYENN